MGGWPVRDDYLGGVPYSAPKLLRFSAAQRSGPGRGCRTGALPAGSGREASSKRGGESRIRVFRSVRQAVHSPVTSS